MTMKYCPELVAFITSAIARDTYTVKEICAHAGITVSTYYEWLHKHADFSEAVKKAELSRVKIIADLARDSLVRKVSGYTVTETRTVKSRKRGKDGLFEKERHEHEKYIPPDTTAVIFALTNGDPATWKNSHSVTARGDIRVTWEEKLTYDPDDLI